MPIFLVDKSGVVIDIKSEKELKYQNEEIVENFLQNKKFLTQGYIYVGQKEWATISRVDGPKWIGSGEATTCSIVVFWSKKENKACVGHFDHGSKQVSLALPEMIKSFDDKSDIVVAIVGGYNDQSKQGKAIYSSILNFLHLSPISIELKLACVGDINTFYLDDGEPAPKARSIAIDLDTGEFIFADFIDRGPEISSRNINTFVGNSNNLINIINKETKMISIGPYTYNQNFFIPIAKNWLKMSDEELLLVSSTSPKAESPKFTVDLRNDLTWFIANTCPQKYFNGKPKLHPYPIYKES